MATGYYIVANGNSCCLSIQIKGWSSCGKLWDCFTRCTNPELVSKYEQILCVTSWELDEWASKSKFVAQSRPALYYSQQQVEHARWETRNISHVESFVSLPSVKAAIYEIRVLFLVFRLLLSTVQDINSLLFDFCRGRHVFKENINFQGKELTSCLVQL